METHIPSHFTSFQQKGEKKSVFAARCHYVDLNDKTIKTEISVFGSQSVNNASCDFVVILQEIHKSHLLHVSNSHPVSDSAHGFLSFVNIYRESA